MDSFSNTELRKRQWLGTALATSFLIAPSIGLAQNPFAIDGAVPDAGAAEFNDPYGSSKELGPVNAADTKLGVINGATAPMLEFTNPNSSTDIVNIWLATKKDLLGDIWLYFAWQRDANTGSSVISYEFQSAAAPAVCDYDGVDQIEPADGVEADLIASCNPWANRQPGDFMIVWDFGGGSTDIVMRTFDGTAFDTGINLSASGFANASLNTDSSRGEGAINLTDAIFGNLQSCFNIANVIPGTITGNSDQADYKDTVLADIGSTVTISNCGTLNLTKATIPAGETGSFDYELIRSGGGAIDYSANTSAIGSLIDDGGSDQLILLPGTDYQLTEDLTGEPTFQLDSIVCDRPAPNTDGTVGFTLEESAITNCVITNELLIGTLTVIKQVVNPYGDPAPAAEFCIALNDDANTPEFSGDSSGTQFALLEGTNYNVSEIACGEPDTSPGGYTATYSEECSGTIVGLTDRVCTITNTLQPQPQAALTLVKTVVNDNGGTASSSDWTLSATLKVGAPNVCDAAGFSGADSGTGVAGSASVSNGLAQCPYVLAESGGLSGYAAGSWSCVGDYSLNGDEVTIGPDGATCTIVNDDIEPTLTLVKEVINDNGGNGQAGDWTLAAAGPTPISGPGGATSGATFSAGSYTLSETGPSGYSASDWTCVGGNQSGSSVALALGESATCTIVNDDIEPSLTLIKQVVNDNGGTAQAADWTLSAAGPTPLAGPGGATSGPSFSAGSYVLSETGPSGYAASDWTCVGGTQSGSSVALVLGESATCTIVNDDIEPSLTLVKQVVNDNGGIAEAADWTLSAAGPTPISGPGVATSGAVFSAGSYALSETGPSGYSASDWTCVGGTQSGNSVALTLGESATCTIVNDDIEPSLTLVKQVVNDNGGTAEASAWTLTAAGPTPVSGPGGATSGASFAAGTYALSESGPSGYAASAWTCVGGTQSGSSIALALGESATCTIVNDDVQPSLTLIKQVVNDNGGTAAASAWTLTATGPTPIAGPGGATSDATFAAGSYALSESGPSGYAASAWSCVGGTQSGSSVALALGESATCTIINDDLQPSLTLVKQVVNDNGGAAQPSDWTLSAAGPTPIAGPGGATSDASFAAGSYALSEIGPSGYAASAWSCVGGTQAGSSVSIALGESATCTIVNDDIEPSLTLVKQVINDNGGNAQASDWNLMASGPTPISGPGGATSGATFAAGSYALSESGPSGYAASDWTCVGGTQAGSSVALALGESATCTIVNDDVEPSLTLVKQVVNNNGGTAQAADWTLTAAGPTQISGAGVATSGAGFAAGSYALSETGPAGYAASGWSCVGGTQAGSSVALALGEAATCTIVNDDIQPSLTLVKQVINDNGGDAQASDWTLSASGPTPISGPGGATSGASFATGTYALSETGPSGYGASAWICVGGTQSGSSVALALGESATCTIVNDDIQPSLTLIKQVVNDNGGTLAVGDFPLFVGATEVGSGVATNFDAGTYQVSEANQPGYAAGSWSGDCSANGSITLAVGNSYSCTLTNDDLPPELKIVKSAVDPVIIPGVEMAFSITVSNIGAGDALNVTLTDPLPPAGNSETNLAPLPWTTTTAGCQIIGGGTTLVCNIGTLAKDPTPDQVESGDEASFTVNLSALVPANYLDPVVVTLPGGGGTLGSNFEIDGNLTDDAGIGADWGTADIEVINVEDAPIVDLSPDYLVDDSFTEGAKEADPVPTVLDHAIPPNKSDLTNFLIAQEDLDGSQFLALGWIRTDSLGTSNFDFELNQSSELSANGVTPVRTDGDAMFSFDFESSGNVVLLTLREWNGDTSKWSDPRSLNIEGTGFAAVNDPELFGTIPAGEYNPFSGQLLPDQSFGEALINMTQTFGANCRTFVSAYVKGRSSASFTAALKDFIAPVNTVIDTCRTVSMLNQATADASNPGQDPVSDSASVLLSNAPEYAGDPDEDGIANYVDPDDDNDGVADEADQFPYDPTESADSDGDGVGDNADAFPNDPSETIDSDGDGVGDNSDAYPTDDTEWADSDGDGVGDNSDAFPNDPTETTDTDGDGVGNNADLDDDNDGVSDADEAAAGTNPLNPDTDGDGVDDGTDAFPRNSTEWTDSDGDGVGDNSDAFPNDPNEGGDTDGDGVGDNADAFPNDGSEWADSDGDGVGDNSDVFPNDSSEWADSDGDGVGNNADAFPNDPDETTDTDGDGVGDNADRFPNDSSEWADSDDDGVGNNADAFPGNPSEWADSDGDGVGDNSDAFPNDASETLDSDGDGVGNNADAFPGDPSETTDSDGDGVGDNSDVFPNNASEWADSDGDGVGNNADAFPNDASEWADSDGDGVGNNADAFPNDSSETTDSDGDGVGDNADTFPNDSSEWADTDGDGVGDNADAFPGNPNETTDSDGDGVGDNADAFPDDASEDSDFDGDGVGDNADAFPGDPNETADTDGDGVGDNSDPDPNDPNVPGTPNPDLDGDGVANGEDAFPNDPTETTDSDGDGVGDNGDAFPNDPNETTDTDDDGVGDNSDAFPSDPTETADSDGDGVGDNADDLPNDPTGSSDVDGDGVGDGVDAFPNDPNESADTDGDGVGDNADGFPNDPGETTDSDGDGVGDNSDPDVDGDGVDNVDDAFPTDPDETTDTDGDGVGDNSDAFPEDPTETTDTDGDGVGDNTDADSDGDGVDDVADAFPTDPTETTDSDGDGVGDNADEFPTDPTETTDTDGDGLGDNVDLDADGDGTDDASDAFPLDPSETTDTDGDGVGDNADAFPEDPAEVADSDGDGVGDNADPAPNDPNVPNVTETTTQPEEVVVATAQTQSNGGGGGGAMNPLFLLGLLLVVLIHRRREHAAQRACPAVP